MKVKDSYVYMYMDEHNCPFYIGKGRGHRYIPSNHRTGHTGNKIRAIGDRNVKVHFLHKDLTDAEALQWERYWIKYFGRQDNGTGQLTNHTDGGEGPSGKSAWNKGVPCSAQRKARISSTLKGANFDRRNFFIFHLCSTNLVLNYFWFLYSYV